MQISLKWIHELIENKTIELEDIIKKLTLGGFEVEEIQEININNKKEIILEISATANRSDSLSIQGLSNEIKVLLNSSNKILNYSLKALNWKLIIENLTHPLPTNSNCSIFLAVKIENLKNKNIPKWVNNKLLSSNINPVNSLLDFQNYILLETGYPFIFYDFNKIQEQLNVSKFNLSISKPKIKIDFLASNEKLYKLNSSILTVNANQLPISIAGMVEGKNIMYSNNTNTLLIEGSLFSSKVIRQQSRNLGLRTDRSARYEKSLQKTYLIEALYRLISLLRISNPTLISKLQTIKEVVEEVSKPIQLRYKTIKEILGPINNSFYSNNEYLTTNQISNYLNCLSLEFSYNKINKIWNIQVPSARLNDLTREIDLIEEIGRLHGFNNFLINLPKIKRIGTEDANYKIYKKITKYLLNNGFNELINYSLVSRVTFLENPVKLFNPLLLDYSNLRVSLLPNLIKMVKENLNQKNAYLNGFEYGHVFLKNLKNNFEEKEYISGIFGGEKLKLSWSASSIELNWFEAKGKIEKLFQQLNLVTQWTLFKSQKMETILHPYRSATIYILNTDTKLGHFGQIHPFLASQLNLSLNLYLFEFNVEIIKEQIKIKKLLLYNQYSVYPKIIKNLSFIIKKDIPFQKVKETLYANGTKFLSTINLLNEYKSQLIPKNHVSLCLQLVFQSTETTLENKKIDRILKTLEIILHEKFNVIIRT